MKGACTANQHTVDLKIKCLELSARGGVGCDITNAAKMYDWIIGAVNPVEGRSHQRHKIFIKSVV